MSVSFFHVHYLFACPSIHYINRLFPWLLARGTRAKMEDGFHHRLEKDFHFPCSVA